MYPQRKAAYADWEVVRGCKVLLYATGDRPGLETQIHPEVLDHFSHHLDAIGDVETINLFLYTRGGSTLAAWGLVNLVRQFCKKLDVIVPSKAHSAGTLICLGADGIMMTKQATLGPIDPSVNGPLNPEIPGAPPGVRFPVSVEAINGFLSFAKEAVGVRPQHLPQVLALLAERVHPLVLGDVYRSRAQIRMLAKRLLARHMGDERKIKRVLEFLCSESGSHDYSIHRQEARDELGLKIHKPDQPLYQKIKAIFDDMATQMELGTPFSPDAVLGNSAQAQYAYTRALIESVDGGSHAFASEGRLLRQQIQVGPVPQIAIQDTRTYEGWRHVRP